MKRNKLLRKVAAAPNLDLFPAETLELPAPATIHSKIIDAALPRITFDLPLPTVENPDLPDEAELGRRFDLYNWQYYNGRLTKPRIQYSTRMKAAGSYTPSNNLIRIGRAYHEIFPEDINITLKHEMIHLLHMKHDRLFKKEAERLGTNLKARYHPHLIRPPKFTYACPRCHKTYPRQKRIVMASCGSCSTNSKFDKRFKLKLISSAARK